MDIKTNEIGDLLRSQIKNINENVPDMPRFAPFRY